MTILANDFVLQRALDKGMLSQAQLESARSVVSRQPDADDEVTRLLSRLIGDGILSPTQVAALRAEEFGLETVDLTGAQIPEDLRTLVPEELAKRHGMVPVGRSAGALRIAVSDPLVTEGADELGRELGLAIETLIAPAEDIAEAIERFYGEATKIGEASPDTPTDEFPDPLTTTKALVGSPEESDAPVIALVQTIIAAAIERRASDIHLEPLARRFRVRYRIDGILVESDDPPHRLQAAIVSRVKIMADISIAERRLPQDGRIQMSHGGRLFDLRVSSLPTMHGESIVMRILDKESLGAGLPQLGLAPSDEARFERLISLPDGIVLVTGPTGSGKTTTLYGALQQLNRSDRKIITVEDPVEYQLSGINQVPVRPDAGMTFGSALRAILRQAPNVIMVGEIRDLETAEIAVNASLTGHMVFSTLHTSDAAGAVARLLYLGVKPFLLAASLRAIVAQRLVRKVCGRCSRPYTPTPAELRSIGIAPADAGQATFLKGTGCPACAGTGYHGRIGIFEFFVINEEIQQMIHQRAGTARLRAKARSLGMCTLREDGARKVSAGLTTIEEVVSITVGDAS